MEILTLLISNNDLDGANGCCYWKKQESGFLGAMMAPTAASMIAPLIFSLIQPKTYLLINAISSTAQEMIPLKISSVNVTKSAGNCEFGHIYQKNP